MEAKETKRAGAGSTDTSGTSARETAVQNQKDRYIAKSKRNPKGWSFRQFGKRTKAWQKMSEAGKK